MWAAKRASQHLHRQDHHQPAHDRLQDEGISEDLIGMWPTVTRPMTAVTASTPPRSGTIWLVPPRPRSRKGIVLTIDWYLNHEEWMNHVTSGDYQNYYQDMYKNK